MSITLKTNEKSYIVGINDMGKTVLLKYLIKQYLDSGINVLLYDSEKEFGEFKHTNLKVYQPIYPSNKEEFETICQKIWEIGNTVLAIESVDFLAEPKKELTQYFKMIIHWGRNRNIGVLMTSRRPANVHKDCCALNKHWFLFHLYLPNDVKYIKQFVGEVAEELKNLKPYYFYHWTATTLELCNPVEEVTL